MTTEAIHAELVALYDGTTPVRSRWAFRADHPFTVTAAFQTDRDRWVEWVFSRELLVEGLDGSAGVGDVRMRPEAERGLTMLVVEIESPEGYAKLEGIDPRGPSVGKFRILRGGNGATTLASLHKYSKGRLPHDPFQQKPHRSCTAPPAGRQRPLEH